MSRVGVALLLGGCAALAGCGQLASTPPERVWTELRSTHFMVQSDLKAAELESLGLDFERSYAALHSYLYPSGDDLPGESRVIVLATAAEYRLFQTEPYPAFFRSRSDLLGSSQDIVFSNQERPLAMEVFQHELVHRFVAHYFPSTPRWLNEGLAQFLASASVDGDDVVVGLPRSSYEFDGWQWKRRGIPFADAWPTIDALREQTGHLESAEYAGAWALVHTLLLGDPRHRAAFGSYMTELHDGQLSEREAFSRHLGDRLLAELNVAYQAFPTHGNLPAETVKLRRWTPEMSLRTMTPAEAYALWGEIRPDNPLQHTLALQDADHAIERDPNASAGYVLRGALHFSAKDQIGARRDLRRAVELEPERREAVHALAALLLELDGTTEEVAKLIDRLRSLARRADDYELLARWELAEARPERAMERALQATQADPSCFTCFETAAIAAARQLDFENAGRLQRTAVNLAAEQASPAMLTTLQVFDLARSKHAPSAPVADVNQPSPVVVRAIMRAHFGSFRACYRASLDRQPGHQRHIKVRLEIGPTGSVTQSEQLENDFIDAQVAPCIVEKLRSLRFPAPASGATTIVQTLSFHG
jgi:tetratricopeptide (TPR) repeat protein